MAEPRFSVVFVGGTGAPSVSILSRNSRFSPLRLSTYERIMVLRPLAGVTLLEAATASSVANTG
ncbi:hypothetical protein L208DRAFT_1407779 [Tricholoma matsutake]|nr:hypothetical protein L208DRAFT_1407779 [Tricholoma matsutake 945]